MTREKILAEIDLELRGSFSDSWHEGARALRAVVELHNPQHPFSIPSDLKCAHCSGLDFADYPCPTIQAIEKELAR